MVLAYEDAVCKRAPVQGQKVLMVMRKVFNYAIDKGWLERNQNPALNPWIKRRKAPEFSHATHPWVWNLGSEIYFVCKKRILPTNESGSCVPIPTIRFTSLFRFPFTTKPIWNPIEYGCSLLCHGWWLVDRSFFGWEQLMMLLSTKRARSSRNS